MERQPGIAARLGEAQARVAAMLLLTLRGTPTLYQGDELGIGKVDITPDKVRDPKELREPGIGLGRDPSRTPMAWDDSLNAGFSSAEPWLPLHPDWSSRNTAAQAGDPASMLSLYRNLLRLRRTEPALSIGGFELVELGSSVLAYERSCAGTRLLVALNLTAEPQLIELPPGTPLLSTVDLPSSHGALRPNEGLILRMEN